MDFMETIEAIATEEASVKTLFGGAGSGVRSAQKGPDYGTKLAEAARFIGDVFRGKRSARQLAEAMTTSDFPQLFGDVVDRMLLANYREAPSSWSAYMKRSTVRDFRTVKRFAIDGAEATLSVVPQNTEYPESSLSDTQYSYAVSKYGRRLPFSWETIVDDDLGAFRDMVERMGRSARRSEEKFATDLFVNSTGPDPTFFSAGNANIITGNPALSVAGLQTGMTVLQSQVDSEGEPILSEGSILVVPPSLEVTAMNILNAMEIRANTSGGGTAAQSLVAANWMKTRITLAVNYYLPIVNTTSGTTAWYLFADPNLGRPASEVGFLAGHEEPEVFLKTSNAVRVGGGDIDPLSGDFDTDAINYRVRHVFGGTLLDPKAAAASTG
jgi:hypothetical protein